MTKLVESVAQKLGRQRRANRVQLGCGPKNALPDWWNVDIRAFPGVDQVLDATAPWPFRGLDYVYGEHFLEHLALDGAVDMLHHAWRSVRVGGKIRLSTPSLEWVLSTHFPLDEQRADRRVNYTFMTNRAFHGWGHQFLYSREVLQLVLEKTGWERVCFCEYGKSDDPNLTGLERHGNLKFHEGIPSVWIVEAERGARRDDDEAAEFRAYIEDAFVKYVRDGH